MTIVAIADIHGNSIALDAVLADSKRFKPDHYLFLGDHVAFGYNPDGVLRQIADIPNTTYIRGNTD